MGERMSRYTDKILELLTEPRTPNELAGMLGITQRTAQIVLMELAADGTVKHRKVGRFHVFWKS